MTFLSNFVKHLIALLFLMSLTPLRASFEDLCPSAKGRGLAEATSATLRDPAQLFGNPAAIFCARLKGAFTFARPFGLKELDYGQMSLALPYKSITVGAGAKSFGNALYRESLFAVAVSHQPFSALHVGAGLSYGMVKIQNYDGSGTFLVDIGANARLHQNLHFGFSIRNLNHSKIGSAREPLPSTLQTGLLVNLDAVNLCVDLCKEIRYPLDFRCGLEIKVLHPLIIRSGIATQPSRFSAGFGLCFKQFRLDYGFSTHSVLNMSHQFSIDIHILQF